MQAQVDYMGKYKQVSNKLKKRFLRKPNVAEASEQFSSLSKVFSGQECPQYAGFCCLAQARCEQTLSNNPGEAFALTKAARMFMEAHFNDKYLRCPGFEEHLSAAINCYNHAVRVNIENKQPALAATLCLELGNALRNLNKSAEALTYYQRAAELQYQNPLDCLNSLDLMASCLIAISDYDGALTLYTEMTYLAQERGVGSSVGSRPIGAFCDILARCEINRVLLLMLLQPTPQRIRPEHAKTLENYSWEPPDDSIPATCLSEELYLLLQSVVISCQSRDISSLKLLQSDIGCHLNGEQKSVLQLILQDMMYG